MFGTMTKTVFITVGTTLFDDLINSVTNPLFLDQISNHGYNRIVIQYGKGSLPHLRDINDKGERGKNDTISQVNGDVQKGTCQIVRKQSDSSSNSTRSSSTSQVEWEIYRFKSSLEKDMDEADLIISHAGAGSIMEGLEHCRRRNYQINRKLNQNLKKLVVVINDQLMDNHQCELAYALEKRKYLYVLPQPKILLKGDVIPKIIHDFTPSCFEGGNNLSFGILMDEFMGYTKTE